MSIGNIKDYTPNFKLIIPSFDIATWHDYIEENFRNIDALFYNLFGINNYSGTWKNITSYTVGQVLFVGEDKDINGEDTEYSGRLVKVLVDHTTDNSDYFNIFYNLHPEYYELFADASTAQFYAQIAQENSNLTIKLRQDVENFLYETIDLHNQTQNLRNDALTFRNDAEDFSKNAKNSANNAQVSAENAQDYLNHTQETYYSAINDINATKSDAIIQIDTNTNQKIDEFISLSNKNTQTATNLLKQTQIAAQTAQNYANEAWGKISNVGDIFYSLRLDDELNGAVECNGNFYELEDFTGTHSIKNLLEQNKLPYVSLEEYENTLNTYGSVRCFGYTPYEKSKLFIQTTVGGSVGYIYRSVENDTIINGNQMTAWLKDGQVVYTLVPEDQIPAYLLLNSVAVYSEYMSNLYVATRYFAEQGSNQFRVPRLHDVYIKAGTANLPNEFNVESLPNITGSFKIAGPNGGIDSQNGAFYKGDTTNTQFISSTITTNDGVSRGYFDASRSSSTYKNGSKVNPDNVRYRAFVQLANSTTENAIISATSAISQLADASFKSKDETITGQKTIETTNDKTFDLKAMDIDSSITPSSDVTQGIIAFKDKLGEIIGYLFAYKLANGSIQVGFQAKDSSDHYSTMAVGVDSEGTSYMRGVTPPNSANSTLLATTAFVKNILKTSGVGLATFSKAQKGYYQFTNGLIINWGYISEGGTDATLTYAKAFSSTTSYGACVCPVSSTAYGYPSYLKSRSATNCVIRRNDSNKPATLVVAVGY